MIQLMIITSGILSPADAVTIARAEAAAAMLPEKNIDIRSLAAGSPEAMELFPKVMSEDIAFELFGSEEDRLLMEKWMKRRTEEFADLPVRKASLWNDDYDRLTEPVKDAAESYGRIMTPAVYINGKLLSSGSAARPCELEKCLKEASKN